LSNHLDLLFNSTVRYGPFAGFKFGSKSWWGGADRGSMLLGLYEREVLDSLVNIPPTHKTFIDLGAADGYYGVGVLINSLFERSYCFEMSSAGQLVIGENALINNVSDKVKIHGYADKDFYKVIPSEYYSNSVLFIDIEGAEFDLLDINIFREFKDAVIFIELHDWFFEDGDDRLKKLKLDASQFFTISELTTTARDMSKFIELKHFSDDDRWLICSEGRGRLMTWLRLDPKKTV